jgi:hypothetical protein
MPEQIDSRGTHMSVRPMTPPEQKRWPGGEIAFTIHYAEGPKAHVMTLIEHAEEFADTIKQACADMRKAKELKERMRGGVVFVRCQCGKLYGLKPVFVLAADFDHICPNCGADVEQGDEVEFDNGWGTKSERLLPEGVIRCGEGIDTHFTDLEGRKIDLMGLH